MLSCSTNVCQWSYFLNFLTIWRNHKWTVFSNLLFLAHTYSPLIQVWQENGGNNGSGTRTCPFPWPMSWKLGVIYSCQDNLVCSIFVSLIPWRTKNTSTFVRKARKGKQDPGRGNYINNFQWQGIKSLFHFNFKNCMSLEDSFCFSPGQLLTLLSPWLCLRKCRLFTGWANSECCLGFSCWTLRAASLCHAASQEGFHFSKAGGCTLSWEKTK